MREKRKTWLKKELASKNEGNIKLRFEMLYQKNIIERIILVFYILLYLYYYNARKKKQSEMQNERSNCYEDYEDYEETGSPAG